MSTESQGRPEKTSRTSLGQGIWRALKPARVIAAAALIAGLFPQAIGFADEGATAPGRALPQSQVNLADVIAGTAMAPGEMIIKLTTTAPTAELWDQIYRQADAYGHRTLARLWDGQLELVHLNGGVAAGISGLESNIFVEYAEPNYLQQVLVVPDDPDFLDLWGLRNVGQTVGGVAGIDGVDIGATAAWEVSTGSTEVVVGVVDTGVDYRHPDLAANMWVDPRPGPSFGSHGFNAIAGGFDPLDDHGHGTHVAGTIGAAGNNGLGVVGVNWTTRIMALKAFDATGLGTLDSVLEAIDYAVQAKLDGVNVRILSNSWGGGGESSALRDMIGAANDNGILFVAAAGNSSSDNDATPFFPASYEVANVISVAATNNLDELASFSNFGLSTVDLGAPGRNILSTVLNGRYDFFSGTSMATPHVSGAAALILATQPALSVVELTTALLNGVDPTPALAGKVLTGGRLNVCRSVSGPNCGALPPPDPNPPSVAITSPADGDTVRGKTTLAADAADDVGILFVRFLADGVFVGADATAPFSVTWDTAALVNGAHVLTAEAVDLGRNTTVSAPVTVTVVDPPSYFVTEVPFEYRSFAGTALGLANSRTIVIASPFPILFAGSEVGATQFIVTPLGYLSFSSNVYYQFNSFLPTARFVDLVAPFWDYLMRLIPDQSRPGETIGSGDVFWTVLGSAPNRELVVEWRDISHFGGCNSVTKPVCNGATFQVVFFEGSSDILFNYLDVDLGEPGWDFGASATVGIQVSPSVATTFSWHTPSLRDNMSLLWTMDFSPPGNTPPSVSIASPTDGAGFAQGDSILFSGGAGDVEDGDLSAGMTWTSSIDGFLGTGPGFSLATLSAGSHSILAEAVDSGGAPGSASVTITVDPAPPGPPTVNTFSVTPTPITVGDSATLSWNTTDADSVTIDNGVGTVALDGSATVTPTVTTTYTLTATSPLGTATSSVTVTVDPAPLPTVDTFSAAPATITVGQSATLSWTSTGANSVSINGGASLPADGSSTVSPTTTTIYNLTATGAGGTATASVTVTVNPAPLPTVDSFSAAPAAIIVGDTATLTWTTTAADSVSINGGTSLPADGSSTVSPATTTTYNLTATGTGGTATSSIVVTVNAAPPPPPPAPANFTLKTFELAGGVLLVEIRDAEAGAPVSIDGIGRGATDGGGRYKNEITGFSSPTCVVTVQVGAAATEATPTGCVPSSPPPPPAPNLPPVAAAGATPTSGEAPLSVVFSSAGSSDPEGGILTFAWDFGDGNTSAQANPSHTYGGAGDFTAVLTVTDDAGATATASVAIVATAPPPPPPPAPANFTLKTFELAGGVLSVEIRDAEAGAPVTIDGIVRGDTDDGGRYKNDIDGFSSPTCVVTVQVGAASTQATPTGCVPASSGFGS